MGPLLVVRSSKVTAWAMLGQGSLCNVAKGCSDSIEALCPQTAVSTALTSTYGLCILIWLFCLKGTDTDSRQLKR